MEKTSHHSKIIVWLTTLVFLAACSQVSTDLSLQENGEGEGATGSGATPVYVSIAGHIEDSLMYTDCAAYAEKREQMLEFAEEYRKSGFAFNLQASYEWFTGVRNCETEEMMVSTGGMNLMDYLATEYGFEIDVHQEGASEELDDVNSGNNVADIRYLAGQVTDHITETVGFQWDNPDQYTRFQLGEDGRIFTDFTWYPELLVGGVSVEHTNGNFKRDMSSMGVWIPSHFTEEDFYVHDESEEARMIYIGSGPNQFMNDWGVKSMCHFDSSVDFVETMANYIESGRWESGEIYTYTLFVPQGIMFEAEQRTMLIDHLAGLKALEAEGKIVVEYPTEIARIWQEEYDGQPNIVRYEEVNPEDYTCKK